MGKKDHFSVPKGRLKRAKHHIARLRKRLDTFLKKNPPSVIEELEPDGVTKFVKVRFTKKSRKLGSHGNRGY